MSNSASASASTSTNTGTGGASLSPSLPSPNSPEAMRQIAEARAALEASMQNIGSSLDTSLRSRAQNLHANSAQLEKQQKDVVKATAGLRKETDKLKKLADEGSRKVKELGNVQNWAEMLERDFLVLEETLRLANEKSDSDWETSSSYSGSESEGGDEYEGVKVDSMGKQESTQKVEGDASVDKRMVDGEGDTQMEDMADADANADKGKGKGKAVEVESLASAEHQVEAAGGSSTATIGSASDPSSSSVHTSGSAVS